MTALCIRRAALLVPILCALGCATAVTEQTVASMPTPRGCASLIGQRVRVTTFRDPDPAPVDPLCGSVSCAAAVTDAVIRSLRVRGVLADAWADGAAPRDVSIVAGEIVGVDAGNRAKRYLYGGGASRISIHGRVLDAKGALIGEFRGEHSIASGKFGGNSEQLMQAAIHGIAEDFADHVATGRF